MTGWLHELEAALPPGRLVRDADVVTAHARDHAALEGAGAAACLVRARATSDVVSTLEVAQRHQIPVVTRGAGTGLAGGANAVDGCILLAVAAMDRILDIDPATRTAVVEPGVLNADLVTAVADQGLWYAPDPASRAISTIGGNIATNAGGACCLKYGVTGDHVAALQVVLPGGDVLRTGSVTTKDVTGLDLTRLLVGSEGTLGVIVEATLRLRPLPAPPATLVASFDTVRAAGEAVVAMEAAHQLSMIELMDRATLRAVETFTRMGLDTDAAALLIVQSDAPTAAMDIVSCEQRCVAAGATFVAATDDIAEGEQFLHARRSALPALERLGSVLLDDVVVPKPAIPSLLDAVARIAAERDIVVGTFGHAGDGNLHPTIVFDQQDAASTATAELAFDDIVRAAIELGGRITGEHGVGTVKRALVDEVLDPVALAAQRRIRLAFDPAGILNPGKAY